MAENDWLMAGGGPLDSVMFIMKTSNTLLTVICIICVLRAYYLVAISRKLHLHVHRFRDMQWNKVGIGWFQDTVL